MRVQEADTEPFLLVRESVRYEFKEEKNMAGVWGFVHLFISEQSEKTLHNFFRNCLPTIAYVAEIEDCISDVFFVIPLKGTLKARKFFVNVILVWHSFTISLSVNVLMIGPRYVFESYDTATIFSGAPHCREETNCSLFRPECQPQAP